MIYLIPSEKSAKLGVLWIRVGALPLTCAQLSATPRAAAHQAPLPTRFSQQEFWNGLPFPPPGCLPDPVFKPKSPESPAEVGGILYHWDTWEDGYRYMYTHTNRHIWYMGHIYVFFAFKGIKRLWMYDLKWLFNCANSFTMGINNKL